PSSTTARYAPDHQRSCWSIGSSGSMATGYAIKAVRDAALETAKSLYGNRPRPAPAYQDCSNGLVVDSRKYGSPTEIASNPKIAIAGVTGVDAVQRTGGRSGSTVTLTSSSAA